jgi:hypothetical protein
MKHFTYTVTINDKESQYDDILAVARLFNSSWPTKTIKEWHTDLINSFNQGWKVVNTGTDGRRITAKRN